MSKIRKFKSFVEAAAAEYVVPKDDDDEVKKYKPRSKGEEDFADAHTTETEPHPTADPSVHNGATTQTSPKGSDAGEKQVVAAGTSVKEISGGKNSKRPADKTDGDKNVVNPIKEGVEELEEAVIDTLRKIVKDKSAQSVKFADGKKTTVDMFTASAMTKVHDALNDANKKKFADAINKDEKMFMKMMDFAMSKVK